MKRKYAAFAVALSVFAVMLTGCASIISGTTQTITIDSNPPGAHVKVGYQTATTPATLSVQKGKSYPVEVAYGPDKRILPLARNVDPMTLLNIIPPLWPGFIVDAVTGALTKYEPEVISVDFTEVRVTRFGY